MKLNIQLFFVFDGPKRPWKRGRRGGGGKPDYERTKLLEQLLDHLKVPRDKAPAEAEAECARCSESGKSTLLASF
jgi:Holliday junction resolvase YEN1